MTIHPNISDKKQLYQPELAIVTSIKSSPFHTLVNMEENASVKMRPYIYIRPGDQLEFYPRRDNFKEVFKIANNTLEATRGKVRIYPPYSKSCLVSVPPHSFTVLFRERIQPSDSKAIRLLEQFHYRGKGLNKLVGRRTVLIAESLQHGIIGYGVLSATVGAAKPRFTLFKTNFTCQMRTKLINKLVRIPRIVIHPEFRGMGLGTMMARHLVEFAREYWDIRGYTPIAVEVIASMTEYHHFFETAGFTKVGLTSGYNKGILPRYGRDNWDERKNSAHYDFLSSQRPKPYLIQPLEKSAKDALTEMKPQSPYGSMIRPKPRPQVGRISFRRLSLCYRVNNNITHRAKEVRDVFDVDSQQLQSSVLTNFSLTIDPGEVVLITGASGSGKSTIIQLLSQDIDKLREHMDITGSLKGLNPQTTAYLTETFDDTIPLVDQVGSTVTDAIRILNNIGLAEAHLYVKRPSQISDGQRYRFAVAMLCDSNKPIWVADEFASTLDPLTAAIVAKGIRKLSYKSGVTLVVAAPHYKHFVDSLIPNKLIKLRWGGIVDVISIRCRFRITKEEIGIRISNTSRQKLTEIQLFGIKINGERQAIRTIGSLNAKISTSEIKLPLETLRYLVGLVVFTRQEIGDVLFFDRIIG